MLHVSGRNPKRDAAKARAIALSGQSVALDGDPRQLRLIRERLSDDDQVETFFGDTDGTSVLWVSPAGVAGSLVWGPG